VIWFKITGERERERKKEASSEQFKKWERIFEVE